MATPTDRNIKLSDAMCPIAQADIDTMKDIPYREAVGSFMYLVVGTRPDFAYFIRGVSQFLTNPGEDHWNAVIRGFKYLDGTKIHGLLLGGKPTAPPPS